MSILKKVPLQVILSEPTFILRAVTTRCKYNGSERTDEIIGFVYNAVNTGNFDTINVFVEQKKPVITDEQLQEKRDSGENVLVEFTNGIVRPYYSERTKSIEDSIKADAVHIVEQEDV